MTKYKYIGVDHCDFTRGRIYEVKDVTKEGLFRVKANDGQALCKSPSDFETLNPKVETHMEICDLICKRGVVNKTLDQKILVFYKELKKAKAVGSYDDIKNALLLIADCCIDNLCNSSESKFDICKKMTDLYERKNHDYGDSFAQMREEYDNAILVRIFDKYSRLKTLLSASETKVKDESIKDTIFDLANYCVMELVEIQLEDEEGTF